MTVVLNLHCFFIDFFNEIFRSAKNLVELAESRHLVTFVELVRKAGLEETLSHTGDYTFFVPDENAWLSKLR